MNPTRAAILTLLALLAADPAGALGQALSSDGDAHTGAGPAKLEEVRVYLILKDNSKVIGELAGFDARQLRVRDMGGKLHSVAWDQLKPTGSYHMQKRLTDPNSAEVNFRLGHYCYVNGLRQDAQEHFTRARQLDPRYAERIKQLYLGRFNGKVGLAIELAEPRELEELERLEQSHRNPTPPAQRPGELVKYQRFSNAIQVQALEQIRLFGPRANEKFNVKLATYETEHFVLFVDWPADEHRPLGQMFESIYQRLCRQFDIPAGENIFLGKMPVFCWSDQPAFADFALQAHKFTVNKVTCAYVYSDGRGFQIMSLYRYSNRLILEKVVTHECVHAFVNRYRTNMALESWLSEGLAEVMTGTMMPRSRTIERARVASSRAAGSRVTIESMFASGHKNIEPAEYALATTVVDYLIRSDPKKFLAMIDQIKTGTPTEKALKAVYDLDYPALESAWRKWVKNGYSFGPASRADASPERQRTPARAASMAREQTARRAGRDEPHAADPIAA